MRFSIKFMGICACLAVGAVLGVKTSESLSADWARHRAAKEAESLIQALSALSKAVVPLSLERSVTQVTLTVKDPIAPRFRTMLNEQRALSAKALADVDKIVAAAPWIKNRAELTAEVQRVRATLTDLRKQVDEALAVPLDDRSELVDAVPQRIIEQGAKLIQAGWLIRDRQTMEAAGIVMLDTVSLQALSIREYGGQGRTHFAIAALHRKPLATNTIGSMRENHGRVVHAWSLIEMVRDQMPPAVQAEIANLKSAYFETYANDRTQMYSSAASGNYPLDFDTFFSRSSAALGAAEKLADTAKDAMLEVARTAQTSNSLALLKETILAVIAGSVMMFMVWLLVFRISARVTKLNAMMGRLAEGDLSIQPEQVASADEIGDMSRAVAVFKTNAERIATLKQDEALRDDMARREKERAMTELADGFERSVGSMVDTVAASAQKLEGAARSLTNAAEATTGRAQAVSEAATAASGNVATVSTASEQLASSVREIGEQVAQSAQIAGRAVTEASTAGGQVRGLSEAAQKIGSIVSLINDIASKTNLLALNATIEAARAGEAGRGFAVVAQEVKGLAEQTSRATADISKQIEGIQHSTAATAGSISSIEKTIGDIHQIAVAISAAVEEQDAATQEIARNVLEAHAGSTTVSTTIQGVSAAAQDSTLASGEVLASARDLAKQADHMRNEIEQFVLRVRSSA